MYEPRLFVLLLLFMSVIQNISYKDWIVVKLGTFNNFMFLKDLNLTPGVGLNTYCSSGFLLIIKHKKLHCQLIYTFL